MPIHILQPVMALVLWSFVMRALALRHRHPGDPVGQGAINPVITAADLN
jgi:hypothetical protein